MLRVPRRPGPTPQPPSQQPLGGVEEHSPKALVGVLSDVRRGCFQLTPQKLPEKMLVLTIRSFPFQVWPYVTKMFFSTNRNFETDGLVWFYSNGLPQVSVNGLSSLLRRRVKSLYILAERGGTNFLLLWPK
jgi:hypothetical protein